MQLMIEIDQLLFQYPRSEFLLTIESMKIEPGAQVAVVGPSGSGKTTLLNLIAGIVVPTSGTITVLDQTISAMPDAQRRDFRIARIGMVFQQFELVEYLTARDNILLPFQINSSLKLTGQMRERGDELARSMGMSNQLNRYPRKLSQGEQQRIAICRALITEPKLLLADEPTGNLDPANKRKILDILTSESRANGQTLLVVTHDMSIVDGFDRIIDFENFRSSAQPVGATA